MSCGQNKTVAKNFLSFLCFSLLSSLKWEHRALGPMSRGTNALWSERGQKWDKIIFEAMAKGKINLTARICKPMPSTDLRTILTKSIDCACENMPFSF